MAKKRDRLEIIHAILKSIQDKGGRARPTHILYKSNLSHQMLTEYLNDLIIGKFIVLEEGKKAKCYCLTDKGHNYIKDYRMIKEFTDSYGLD
jgi:predicted transcriptional regulator